MATTPDRKPLHGIVAAIGHDERRVVLTEAMTADGVESALKAAFDLEASGQRIRGLRCPAPPATPPASPSGEAEETAAGMTLLEPGAAKRSLRARYHRMWRRFDPDEHLQNPTFIGVKALLQRVDAAAKARRGGVLPVAETTRLFLPVFRTWLCPVGVRALDHGPRADLQAYDAELRDLDDLRRWIAQRGMRSVTRWRGDQWYHLGSFLQVCVAFDPPPEFSEAYLGETNFLSVDVIGRSQNLALDLPPKDDAGNPLVYELVFGTPVRPPGFYDQVYTSLGHETAGLVGILGVQLHFLLRVIFRLGMVVLVCLAFGNSSAAASLETLYSYCYFTFVKRPLHLLYRNGPFFEGPGFGIGFWEGRSASEICGEITKTREIFWRAPDRAEECDVLLASREAAFVKTCEAIFFLYCAVYAWRYVILPELRFVVTGRDELRPFARMRGPRG